jgi:hypothetical protein
MKEKLNKSYVKEVVNPLLPNAKPGAPYSLENEKQTDILVAPEMINGMLKDSPYEYSEKPLRFIHYTSLAAAKSILKSGKFRLSNLASMSDFEELSFALKRVYGNKSAFTIDNYKHEVFTLSMNEFKEDDDELRKNWLDYGDCGFGVGLVITFPKENIEKWHKHFLGKVLYDKENLHYLHELHVRHKEFVDKLNGINIEGQVKNFVLPVAAFHKSEDFVKEQEVRFMVLNKDLYLNSTPVLWQTEKTGVENLTKVKEDEYRDYDIYINENQKSFIEIALNPDEKDDYKELNRPIPKIEKVILGQKLWEASVLKNILNKIKDGLLKNAKSGLGYNIEVNKSRVKFSDNN